MKKLLLFGILILALNSTSQITLIPDANFEQALIDLGYELGTPDGSVPTAYVNTITSLDISSSNISDLTGIQDFVSLTFLYCVSNQLTNLNVSQNTSLTYLNCGYNQISNIDLSQNILLEYIGIYNNQLTDIDLSQNTALIYLFCNNNQITNLVLTQNSVLRILNCSFNQITSLNLSQNIELEGVVCSNNQLVCLNIKNGSFFSIGEIDITSNPNLWCVEVNNAIDAAVNWTVVQNEIDPQTSFSTDCGNFCSLGVTELNTNTPKKLSKIIDLTGREIQYKKNTMMIYIYEDGSSERVIELE